MVNVTQIYEQVLQSVASSIAGYEGNFTAEEQNAYVEVTYSITSPTGVEEQFNWLLTKGQPGVRPAEPDLATWEKVEHTLEDLTGVTDDSFEIPSFKVPEIPAVSTPQPEVSSPPPIISINFEDVNPFTTPIIELPPEIRGGSPVSGDGGRENPQLGSSTSRGGVLGGRNYSNPQDAIDNEFRFRTRITDRER